MNEINQLKNLFESLGRIEEEHSQFSFEFDGDDVIIDGHDVGSTSWHGVRQLLAGRDDRITVQAGAGLETIADENPGLGREELKAMQDKEAQEWISANSDIGTVVGFEGWDMMIDFEVKPSPAFINDLTNAYKQQSR